MWELLEIQMYNTKRSLPQPTIAMIAMNQRTLDFLW